MLLEKLHKKFIPSPPSTPNNRAVLYNLNTLINARPVRGYFPIQSVAEQAAFRTELNWEILNWAERRRRRRRVICTVDRSLTLSACVVMPGAERSVPMGTIAHDNHRSSSSSSDDDDDRHHLH